MRARLLILLLCAACSGPARERAPEERPAQPEKANDESAGVEIARDTDTVRDDRPPPSPSKQELADFDRIWELYRRGDPRWPLERDRFKRRSDAAGYLLAAHVMRHYMQVNQQRDRAVRALIDVKREVVAVGEPCVPALVNLLVLDRYKLSDGRFFYIDDLTRQDAREMLETIGGPAASQLLRTLARPDLGVKGRRLTALALGGTRDPRAYDPLVRLLRDDPSWQVRADAASALAALGDVRAIEPLQQAVKTDPDAAVVRRAGKARLELLAGRTR